MESVSLRCQVTPEDLGGLTESEPLQVKPLFVTEPC